MPKFALNGHTRFRVGTGAVVILGSELASKFSFAVGGTAVLKRPVEFTLWDMVIWRDKAVVTVRIPRGSIAVSDRMDVPSVPTLGKQSAKFDLNKIDFNTFLPVDIKGI